METKKLHGQYNLLKLDKTHNTLNLKQFTKPFETWQQRLGFRQRKD